MTHLGTSKVNEYRASSLGAVRSDESLSAASSRAAESNRGDALDQDVVWLCNLYRDQLYSLSGVSRFGDAHLKVAVHDAMAVRERDSAQELEHEDLSQINPAVSGRVRS